MSAQHEGGTSGKRATRDRERAATREARQAARDRDVESAELEGKRRIAARDRQEAKRAAHEKRIGPVREAAQLLLARVDTLYPRGKDGRPNRVGQEVSEALVNVLHKCRAPRVVDTPCAPISVPAPTVADLEATLSILEGPYARDCRLAAPHAALVAQLRGLCADRPPLPLPLSPQELAAQLRRLIDVARADDAVNEAALAQCDPRIVDAVRRRTADRAEQDAWQAAPARRARPGESLQQITARVLVERGYTPCDAARTVYGLSSADVPDSPKAKALYRAVKVQRAPTLIPEPTPEQLVDLERMLSESEPRRQAWLSRRRSRSLDNRATCTLSND